jgi:hypothetical protein
MIIKLTSAIHGEKEFHGDAVYVNCIQIITFQRVNELDCKLHTLIKLRDDLELRVNEGLDEIVGLMKDCASCINKLKEFNASASVEPVKKEQGNNAPPARPEIPSTGIIKKYGL